jgi:hypothetical protein
MGQESASSEGGADEDDSTEQDAASAAPATTADAGTGAAETGVHGGGVVNGAKRVFVSSETYTGDLGGLDGADAKCQALADAAHLGGTFKAWLSTSTVDAADRLTHSTRPYTLVDGTLIANDWTDLTTVKSECIPDPAYGHNRCIVLRHLLDMTERGGPPPTVQLPGACARPHFAWSSTEYNGVKSTGHYFGTCRDWTDAHYVGSPTSAALGTPDLFDGHWTGGECFGNGPFCTYKASIYCFEQ